MNAFLLCRRRLLIFKRLFVSVVKNPSRKFSIVFLFAVVFFPPPVTAQTESLAAYYAAGLDNLNKQNYEQALTTFQTILKIKPDDFRARHGLAISLIGLEKLSEASREIAKLLVREPQNADLLEMAAQTFWQQKRFAETEIVLQRRLKLGIEKAELWTLYGDALDAQKKTAQAATAYENAVRLIPDSIDLKYALGVFYWKLIRYDDAEKVFLDILRRQPNEPRASFNLGDIYLTNGDFAKALPFLETAARAFPNEYDTRFAYGRALVSVQKFALAVTELQTAIGLRPEIAEGHYYLGLALQKSGKTAEAKTAFKKAQDLKNAKRESEAIPKTN